MDTFNDYDLISRYLEGDETSLEVLISKYMPQIYGFVFKYVNNAPQAEDITQEVFVKVWKNLKKIDRDRNFRSWIFTVAKNTALDFIKKKKALPFSSFENSEGKNVLMDKIFDGELLPDKVAMASEAKDVFTAAINELSLKYRSVLSLYYYQYLNFREIAEVLKEPINTIKSRHRRGLILLKKTIAKDSF